MSVPENEANGTEIENPARAVPRPTKCLTFAPNKKFGSASMSKYKKVSTSHFSIKLHLYIILVNPPSPTDKISVKTGYVGRGVLKLLLRTRNTLSLNFYFSKIAILPVKTYSKISIVIYR